MNEEMYPDRVSTKSERENINPEKPPNRWLNALLATNAVTSVIGLIILFLLLGIPVSILVIDVRYQHRHFCPIEPRISLFLTVGCGVALGYFVLSIVLSLITMFLYYTRSFKILVPVTVLAMITMLIQIFLFIWVIIGSVWTFSIYNDVEYTNPRRWRKYCDETLYMFTFIYLIIIIVLWAIQRCVRCFFGIFHARQDT
ncbi:unnamed protein product [Rotaria socialis]|uniref:Uncharacterized protein n=1 Tax=Rotaria socialis TaxID=392032 RepID=A0A818RMZ1_9BILA|nr:unnamed protein product [Rotaria socialis]CAF4643783.1 unnamed protein product [Rotaria socialis]